MSEFWRLISKTRDRNCPGRFPGARLFRGSRMSEPENDMPRKWCPLCGEWKAATVYIAETRDGKLVESQREVTYCSEFGARLRDEQK